jgi:uncharacterized protein YfaS (alpha-2-macroglobulin family)
VAGLIVAALIAVAAAPGVRDELWKKVDEAQKKGLPKSAIEELNPIIEQCLKDKAYPEAIKAIGRKIALEGNIQGNKPEEKIIRLQAEIEKAPAEMKPVMEVILADWYWQYFQHNRWRFSQRTQTDAAPGKDFTTWDLPRIMAEIAKHFETALAAEVQLKKIPVADYDVLLVKGTTPDTYRPTLFDFVAHEALQFYQSGEQAGAKAEDTFEILADSPAFASVNEFLGWKPDTTDEASVTLKAVRLYQNLLTFHKDDKDRTAFIDADLLRLNFAYNKAVGEGKDERYETALKRFVDEWADHEISARALWHWANVLKEQGRLTEAHALAKRGYGAFPESYGGKMCWNVILEIEGKQVSIATERVWNEPLPNIAINYKNLTKAYFKAIPWNFEDRLRSNKWGPENLSSEERNSVLARKADLEWSCDLPATSDFQLRTEAVPAPKGLKPGFYFIIASHDPAFGDKENMVQYAAVWVSDLAIVSRIRQGNSRIEGMVVDALSGAPVSNAAVQAWVNNNNNTYSPGGSATTDGDGLFGLPGNPQRTQILLARNGEQSLATQGYWVNNYDHRPKPYVQTVFFTDRSLYRPGQTIQFKGICYRVDQEKDLYEVAANQPLAVLFSDVNGKEVARQSVKANEWGSFSGSFTAPRSGLTGRMQIYIPDEIGRGYAYVNVEEYKRPKFQVAVEAPKDAARLSEAVEVKGKATAYTGVAIGGAKVSWRVTRGVRYPMWWYWRCWWCPPYYGEAQEIAHGKAVTQSDGTFKVSFVAKPDLSVEKEDEPTFIYTVYADVTDTTGETRSAQRQVNAGYTALSASMSANEWLEAGKPVELAVRTTSLDGVGQAAEGVVKVYALKQPQHPVRPKILSEQTWPPFGGRNPRRSLGKAAVHVPGKRVEPKPDPSNPNSWELGEMVTQMPFKTDESGSQKLQAELKAGIYRATLETKDRFGKAVTALLPVQVVDIKAGKFAVKIPNHVASPKWSVEPGETFLALWGTGYDKGRAYVEIEHRRKVIKAFWTAADNTQEVVEQAVTEAMRGGFTLRVTYVRENRAYLTQRQIAVPWSNKKLDVKWERFVSKLEPGQKETWTAIVSDPEKKTAPSEMVAALYDASLDAYRQHGWQTGFNVWRSDWSNMNCQFENRAAGFNHWFGYWVQDFKSAEWTYRDLPAEIAANLWGYAYFGEGKGGGGGMWARKRLGADRGEMELAAAAPGRPAAKASAAMDADGTELQGNSLRRSLAGGKDKPKSEKRQTPSGAPGEPDIGGDEDPDLSKVTARKNLNETAFFFPHILADSNGVMKMEFTMPEALTEWKFLGFAHDAALRGGGLQDKAVTSKELMVEPNPPRFVREGDEIEFTVKVSNKSAARQTGKVKLTLADARTLKSVDKELGSEISDLKFDIPSGESRTFSWRLTIPDGLDHLTYKTVGSTGRLSDGEENYLPVLSRRILVIESLPLPVRGKQTKDFKFDRLMQSGKSKTLKNETLTVQMVSQPAWYAVMALPYLMESPHECTEQTFNRLYANALAKHIAGSDPKIRRVFDQWKGTPALDSPLERNQDLKSVTLEETPWLRQAQSESQARRNVGILFDENRLNDETARLLKRMADLQLGDGRWPWFPGGHPSDYITLYITTGYGRLRHLGVKGVDMASAVRSLNRLDQWVDEQYREILRSGHKDENHLNPTIAFYLYGRSFFLEDRGVDAKHKEAVDYWLGQAKKYWLQLANRQSQGHLAVALKRWGDKETALGIMASIKERSVTNEEMGMFWRDTELSWWWYRAPIETQAIMIEAFDEVLGDAAAVEECRVWLLKQKQTQDWKTTKATADAVYGLLLRGQNWLASDALVEVSLGGEKIKPEKVEAGTGFYEQRFVRKEIVPDMGKIKVTKSDDGVSWGSVHWQYLEDMTKVTSYEGTPLKLVKKLFVKENTKKGPVLKSVSGPLAVGDELVVRIELRVDRDMEYVHLKDQRGSGTEPVNVLSKYRYQDGLAYYESTKDTASHFFIDYLPKGVYVFEYSSRIQHKGNYQTGIATIQCMYAPEFNSHSESFNLEVK